MKYAEQLKADGLILDDDVVNRLLNVLKFSYDEQFEVTMPFANKEIIFSSILNRIYLREKEDILISKYSRKTEFEFTVLGIVTQAGNENIEMFDEEEVVDGFRSAIQNTIDKMAGVETFLLVVRVRNAVLNRLQYIVNYNLKILRNYTLLSKQLLYTMLGVI